MTGTETMPGSFGPPPPPPDDEPAAPEGRMPRWGKVTIGIAIALVVVFVAGFVIHLPYSTISPGEAVSVPPLIKVSGAETFPSKKGDIRLLFVRERNHVNLWQYLAAQFDDDTDVFKAKVLNPQGLSQQQLQQQGFDEMRDAKLNAATVALDAAGYKVPVRLLVTQLVPGYPAAKVLKLGDQIETAAGQPVTSTTELRRIISAHKAGDKIDIGIVRDGKPKTVTVGIGESDGRKIIGVGGLSPQPYNFPVKIDVDTSQIGGPSAGLAMSLAILDAITPGDLTGGLRVATTGTIDTDGNVGEIGGIAQKAVAVRASHAQLFLVPKCQPDDDPAQRAACERDLQRVSERVGKSVKVVPVGTFAEALAALRAAGGQVTIPVAPGARAA